MTQNCPLTALEARVRGQGVGRAALALSSGEPPSPPPAPGGSRWSLVCGSSLRPLPCLHAPSSVSGSPPLRLMRELPLDVGPTQVIHDDLIPRSFITSQRPCFLMKSPSQVLGRHRCLDSSAHDTICAQVRAHGTWLGPGSEDNRVL